MLTYRQCVSRQCYDYRTDPRRLRTQPHPQSRSAVPKFQTGFATMSSSAFHAIIPSALAQRAMPVRARAQRTLRLATGCLATCFVAAGQPIRHI